jgi:hypothetical protein
MGRRLGRRTLAGVTTRDGAGRDLTEPAKFPFRREIGGNFFPVADKNIIPMNGLRGEFPPSEREFIGHDRELNRSNWSGARTRLSAAGNN